jgi:hypothetical protein
MYLAHGINYYIRMILLVLMDDFNENSEENGNLRSTPSASAKTCKAGKAL